MHIWDLDIVMCVWIDIRVYTRFRFVCFQIVLVRLKHIRDELLYCICKIYCHSSYPFSIHRLRCSTSVTGFNLALFLLYEKYCFLIKR